MKADFCFKLGDMFAKFFLIILKIKPVQQYLLKEFEVEIDYQNDRWAEISIFGEPVLWTNHKDAEFDAVVRVFCCYSWVQKLVLLGL